MPPCFRSNYKSYFEFNFTVPGRQHSTHRHIKNHHTPLMSIEHIHMQCKGEETYQVPLIAKDSVD